MICIFVSYFNQLIPQKHVKVCKKKYKGKTSHSLETKGNVRFFTCFQMVGVTGFEPAASWSRTKRSTELSHTPVFLSYIFYHAIDLLSTIFQ